MLGENIKTLRKQKGYSQNTLAEQLNVVRQTISKWEQGLSVPDADMLERMVVKDVIDCFCTDTSGCNYPNYCTDRRLFHDA